MNSKKRLTSVAVLRCRSIPMRSISKKKMRPNSPVTAPSCTAAGAPACSEAELMFPDVPAPENVPPLNNPDPKPGDPKPQAPPADEEPGRRYIPIDLPGQPHAPERARF